VLQQRAARFAEGRRQMLLEPIGDDVGMVLGDVVEVVGDAAAHVLTGVVLQGFEQRQRRPTDRRRSAAAAGPTAPRPRLPSLTSRRTCGLGSGVQPCSVAQRELLVGSTRNGRIANSAVERCVSACSACSARCGWSQPAEATNSVIGQTTPAGEPLGPGAQRPQADLGVGARRQRGFVRARWRRPARSPSGSASPRAALATCRTRCLQLERVEPGRRELHEPIAPGTLPMHPPQVVLEVGDPHQRLVDPVLERLGHRPVDHGAPRLWRHTVDACGAPPHDPLA
jgi:hypothetical protein